MNRYVWTDEKGTYPEKGQHWCENGECKGVCLNIFKTWTIEGKKKYLCPKCHAIHKDCQLVKPVPVDPIPPPLMMIRG